MSQLDLLGGDPAVEPAPEPKSSQHAGKSACMHASKQARPLAHKLAETELVILIRQSEKAVFGEPEIDDDGTVRTPVYHHAEPERRIGTLVEQPGQQVRVVSWVEIGAPPADVLAEIAQKGDRSRKAILVNWLIRLAEQDQERRREVARRSPFGSADRNGP